MAKELGTEHMVAQNIFVEPVMQENTNKIISTTPLSKQKSSIKDSHNNLKNEPGLSYAASRRNSDMVTSKLLNRLKNKTRKIKLYWNHNTLVIPNVFKMNQIYGEYTREVVEFNDLSLKSILVMNSLNRTESDPVDEGAESDGLRPEMYPICAQAEESNEVTFSDLELQFRLI